jgi:hypothetical protein
MHATLKTFVGLKWIFLAILFYKYLFFNNIKSFSKPKKVDVLWKIVGKNQS